MSHRCGIPLLMCVLSAMAGGSSVVEGPDGGVDAGLLKRIEALAEKLKTVGDMSAEFEQKKFTPLLKKPLVSSGRVWVKGEKTLWHATKPYETWTLTDGQSLRLYDPKRKTVEVYDMDRRLAELAASPIPRLEVLLEKFGIKEKVGGEKTEGVLVLELVPRDESIAKYVAAITVHIDTATGLARAIAWSDADGERTVMAFTRVKLNTGLKDEQLAIPLPADVKVVRPLDGAK